MNRESIRKSKSHFEEANITTTKHKQMPLNNCSEVDIKFKIERRIKIFFLFPFLISRQNPDITHPCHINTLIKQRLSMWKLEELPTLIEDYKQYMVYIQTVKYSSPSSYNKKVNYQKLVDLIQLGQLHRVRCNIV